MSLFFALLLFFSAFAADAPPARSPTDVGAWLHDLADEDPAIRSAARQQLLGMSSEQLAELKQLVADGQANLPSQREALYDIVRHAYLANLPYQKAEVKNSFIGLYRQTLIGEGSVAGVCFERRLPGFGAYRALEDGDIILGVREHAEMRFERPSPLNVIRENVAAGETIQLIVLRDDRVITTPLTLSETPAWQGDGGDWALQAREATAQQYWKREFEPLFESGERKTGEKSAAINPSL